MLSRNNLMIYIYLKSLDVVRLYHFASCLFIKQHYPEQIVFRITTNCRQVERNAGNFQLASMQDGYVDDFLNLGISENLGPPSSFVMFPGKVLPPFAASSCELQNISKFRGNPPFIPISCESFANLSSVSRILQL